MLKNSDPALYQSFLTAQACHQRGDLINAEAIYSRLLALDPADDELLFLFGSLQISKGALDVGLECLRLAQQLKPDQARIPYVLGVALQNAGRLDEAVVAYRRAVMLHPACREAWENLCAACYDLEDYPSGLEAAEQALKLDPASALAVRGAANCLTAMGRRAEALKILNEALYYHPAHPELRIHQAWELLANGDFRTGWRALEWRYSRQGISDQPPRSVPFPRWNGEPLAGKTVLVYGEQGIGDEIMVAPFVLGIVQSGGRCVLECDPRLEALFARAFPQCILLRREEREQICWRAALGNVDYAISAFSLPLYFAHPLQGGAFLLADPERVKYWRQRLQVSGPGLKVGVSWRGGADAKARKLRSIDPAQFGCLVDGSATFVSLQYGALKEEINAVSPNVLHFPEIDPIRDMDEFAALLAALDCVISVDNSTVHLAGALGVKTLLLLPVYSEWRWGNALSGESPWYRSVEFIRQSAAREIGWQQVLEQAGHWLRSCLPVLPGQLTVGMRAEVMVLPPPAFSALLVGDTHYWYHWGCACTSLGVHEGLRQHFDAIRVLPLRRLLSGCPALQGEEDLDSDEFFHLFEQSCPDIAAQIRKADWVVVNGEGSIHGTHALPLFLLYLAYVSSKRYGRRVAVINHSCYPGEQFLPGGATTAGAFYKRVYAVLDAVVVREPKSLANVLPFNHDAQLGFDCLPRFLAAHGSADWPKNGGKLVLGGSVSWTAEMVACFTELAAWMHGQGYAIEILSGAKALLAGDEVGFVAAMANALRTRRLPFELHFPISEREWLEAIGSASLLLSGRFHYSIAAAFQQVPFLVAESNTAKIAGLLDDLGIEAGLVALARQDYGQSIEKARRLLTGEKIGICPSGRLEELRRRAERNFAWAERGAAPVRPRSAEPVMIRAYHGAQKGATAFFRNRPFIETLFSRLQTEKDDSPVKILVHACSVGAEPYSLALWWLHKVLPERSGPGEIEIVATDINAEFLAFAKQGCYPDSLLAGMTGEEQSWFERTGGSIVVPERARRLVRFLEPMSFVDGDPGEQFDAVLIMNALTYVSPAEQSAALSHCAKQARKILAITAFHPDTVRADLQRAGFEPVMEQHRRIHEAWGDRLASGPIPPDSPDYSWKLPPYDETRADFAWCFGVLFQRSG